MQGMEQPSPLLLYLGGEGEAVVLLRYPLILLLHQLADADRPITGGVIASPLIMVFASRVEW